MLRNHACGWSQEMGIFSLDENQLLADDDKKEIDIAYNQWGKVLRLETHKISKYLHTICPKNSKTLRRDIIIKVTKSLR